jgi:hypothetical protein
MKRALLPVLFASVSLACGSSSPTPNTPSTGTGGTTATAPKSDALCVATITAEKNATWVPVGTLAISVNETDVTKVELKDGTGKAVPTENAPKDKSGDFKTFITTSTCKVGGIFAVIDEAKNKGAAGAKSGTLAIDLYKPAKDDEPGDIASLCTRPAILEKLGKEIDPSQEPRVAAAFYEESLTSQKWRAWQLTMEREFSKVEDEKGLVAIKKAKADELERAAKASGKTSCWFADALRGK